MDTALAVGLVEMFHVKIYAAKRGRPRALLVKTIEKELSIETDQCDQIFNNKLTNIWGRISITVFFFCKKQNGEWEIA